MRLFIACLLFLPHQLFALDINAFYLENCATRAEQISPLYEYSSENCPNLTGIVSCIADTGFGLQGQDSDKLREDIAMFKDEGMASCQTACEDGDLGACAIHGSTKLYGIGMDSPALRYQQVKSLEKACEGGLREACGQAGQEMQIFWLAQNDALLESVCEVEDRAVEARQCLHGRFVADYIDSEALEIPAPTQILSKGCAQDDVTSCRLLMGFYIDYYSKFDAVLGDDASSELEPEFDAVAIVENVCAKSTAVQCADMNAKLANYQDLTSNETQ